MKIYFDHEKLDVYQEAIAFCGWVGELINSISAKAAAKDQFDRASTSIPLNIAEGNSKFSSANRARLDVLVAQKFVNQESMAGAKEQLVKIVQMLVGLLCRFSGHAELVREDAEEYRLEHEHDYEHQQDYRKEPALEAEHEHQRDT